MPLHAVIHSSQGDPAQSYTPPVEGGPPPDPGVNVTAPYEAVNGAQLTTQLGFGTASMWKYINPLNDASGPQYPTVGVTVLTPSAGGVPNTAGPLDSFDKAVTATDADADGQWSGAVGVIDPAGRRFAMLVRVRFNALPAGNRDVCGHDGADDFFLQYMQTTGRVRAAAIAGTTVLSEIAVNHNDGLWHDILLLYIPGASGFTKCVSDLGASTPTSTAAQAQMDWTGAFFIHRNSSAAPCDVSYVAVAISDGTTAEDDAIMALYDNASTAITNLRTATGR